MARSLEELTAIFREAARVAKDASEAPDRRERARRAAQAAAVRIRQLRQTPAQQDEAPAPITSQPQRREFVGPPGALQNSAQGVGETGLIEGLKEKFTGEERKTPETEKLPDWGDMPEMNDYSAPGFASALVSVFGGVEV